MMKFLVALLLVVIAMPSSAFAATYYIDTTGSDGNNGTSTTTPWRTVANINTHTLVAGDSVLFRRGQTFTAAKISLLDDSGALGNPIIFDAYDTGADPILDGQGINRNFDIRNSASYITIRNLNLRYPSESGVFLFTGTFTGLVFDHLTVTGTTTGAFILNSNATSSGSTYSNITINGFTTGFNMLTKSMGDTYRNITVTSSSSAMTLGGSTSPVQNLTLDTISASGGTGSCINLNNTTNATGTNITAQNCGAGGIAFSNTIQNVYLANSTFNNNGTRGISFNVRTINVTVATTTANGNHTEGIFFSVSGAATTTLSGVTANNNGGAGLSISVGASTDTASILQSSFINNGTVVGSDGLLVGGIFFGTININNVTASGNTNDGFGIHGNGIVNISNSTSTNNGVNGLGSDGDGFSWHDLSSGSLFNSYGYNNKKSAIANISTSSVAVYNNVLGNDTSGTIGIVTLLDNAALSFYNNTLYNPSGAGTGILIQTTGTTTLRNNVISGFNIGISKSSVSTNTTEDYDIVAGASGSAVSGTGFSLGLHSLTASPAFVDAASGNFRMAASSVAVNAGTNLLCSPTDKDGVTRQGICDIGAYEYIDTTAPVITLNGASTMTSYAGQSYTDPGATATDNVDDSVAVTTSGTVNNSAVGTYTLTYNATDAAGNVATPVTRTVIVQNAAGNGAPVGLITSPSSTGSSVSIPNTFPTNTTAPSSSSSGAATASASYLFLKNLRYKMMDLDVLQLQKYLNAHGFALAANGPGSSSNETNYFGLLTLNAVVRFQEAYPNEILAPNGLLAGTGYFGPSTRAFVNTH